MPLADTALQSMLGPDGRGAGAAASRNRDRGAPARRRTGSAELQNHLSKLLASQGLRKFLEQTLIPLNEAVHERVVRGEMQNLPGAALCRDLAQRLLRDARGLVRRARESRQVLLATPPNDPNQLGLAILELLLLHRRRQLPDARRRHAGAGNRRLPRRRYQARRWCVLLFDRGISGKIAGQEIRGLRACAAGRNAADRQRTRGEPAREADRQHARRRRFQLGDCADARRRCAKRQHGRARPGLAPGDRTGVDSAAWIRCVTSRRLALCGIDRRPAGRVADLAGLSSARNAARSRQHAPLLSGLRSRTEAHHPVHGSFRKSSSLRRSRLVGRPVNRGSAAVPPFAPAALSRAQRCSPAFPHTAARRRPRRRGVRPTRSRRRPTRRRLCAR